MFALYFVTSEDSNLIPVGSHSHCMLVKTFTYFSTKPDLVAASNSLMYLAEFITIPHPSDLIKLLV